MAETTPFDMYAQEFELRLKLIEIVEKWNKDMAEAEVKWAEANLTMRRQQRSSGLTVSCTTHLKS